MAELTVLAAGGVLWHDGEIAIVHRPRYDDWSLPKGKTKDGEHLLRCALREIAEETGFEAVAGRFLGETAYRVAEGRKAVRYWALRRCSGAFVPGREVDDLRWLPVAEAREALTYERDREILDRFSAGPPGTTTVVLVRHGSAGDRSLWGADDDLRPLDDTGGSQARGLADLLPCYGVRRVLSAPPLRCVETVRPLADTLGVPVEIDPLFAEDGYWDHRDAALERLRALGAAGVPVVVCSQGGAIPDLVERLHQADGVVPAHVLGSRKGSAWALSFAGPALVGAEYHART